MEVRHVQQIALPRGQPCGSAQALALRTMSVAAGVIGDAAMAAIVTGLHVAAERRRAAALDGGHDAVFNTAQVADMSRAIGIAMAAEDTAGATKSR